MIYEERQLGADESSLRHADGATDLTAHRGEWYALRPAHPDELLAVHALELTIAGPGLLSRIDGLLGDSLEVEFTMEDRFGQTHPLAGSTLVSVETADDFRDGVHTGTFMDTAAGTLRDGTPRPGLRGSPVLSGATPAAEVQWDSAPIPLRYGSQVERLAWDIEDVRTPTGDPAHAAKLLFRVGVETAGAIAWRPWDVANDSSVSLAGVARVLDEPLPRGTHIQWRALLTRPTLGGPSVARTATVFWLGAWVRLRASRWTFASLASLLLRSDSDRALLAGGWDADDVALLRVPVGIELSGRQREALSARLVGGGADGLSAVRVAARSDLRFEGRD